MIHQSILLTTLLFLEFVYSLPLQEKIEPVELFHHCIDPIKDENDPDKSPVLLLHALLGTHKSYKGVDQIIADRTKRRVCSVDLRNHGDSPWNNRTDIAALAVDVGHFLDMQSIKKVNLIGESLGGKVAIHYTLNNPDRVESIVTEDVRPNSVRKIGFMALKVLVQFLKKMVDSQPKDMTENEAKERAQESAKDILKMMESYDKMPDDISDYIDIKFVDGRWTLKHNLNLMFEKINKPEEIWTTSTGLYNGPALFFYGTESMFKVGDDRDEILRLFPNAKLLPVEGAGHLIHELHHEFEDIVVNFLNKIN